MGTFVNLLAAKHQDRPSLVSEVVRALRRQHITTLRDPPAKFDDQMREFESRDGWSYLDFHWAIWDYEAVLREVSRTLETQVFFFQIYDGDYWTYHLYDCGDLVGKFASILDYWEEPWDPVEWSGNLADVQSRLEISDPLLAKYLRHLSPDDEEAPKVDPSDEFELGDPWVLVDFMKRLGLTYPDAADPMSTHYLKQEKETA